MKLKNVPFLAMLRVFLGDFCSFFQKSGVFVFCDLMIF